MRHFNASTICKTCLLLWPKMLEANNGNNSIASTTISKRSIIHCSTSSSLNSKCHSTIVPMYATTNVVARRHFYSLGSLAYQLFQGTIIIAAFTSFGNTYCNIRKYGKWRFTNKLNMSILAEDFPTARYIGGVLGFLFWWFFAGGTCFQPNRDLDQVPFNVRIGPL